MRMLYLSSAVHSWFRFTGNVLAWRAASCKVKKAKPAPKTGDTGAALQGVRSSAPGRLPGYDTAL